MGASVVQRTSGGRKNRRRSRGHAAAMAEINVTPFVDVMLVLLIIFMVAAPLLTVGVPVELPKTAAKALPSEEEEPLTVSITADGLVALMETEIAVDELIPRLRAVATERSNNKVFLRADGSVAYEQVVQIMGALNAAGFNDIGLVTDTGGPSLTGQ